MCELYLKFWKACVNACLGKMHKNHTKSVKLDKSDKNHTKSMKLDKSDKL